MKLCVSETVRGDRIERVISDGTVMVVSSPMMLRRKKKGQHPIIKALIRVQQYDIELYTDFLAIENLYGLADEDAAYDGDYKTWSDRWDLRSKIAAAPAYWWLYDAHRGVKEDVFDYLFKTTDDLQTSDNMMRTFERDYKTAKQWGVLKHEQTIPILRRYRIINKLLDELIIVKLSEDL